MRPLRCFAASLTLLAVIGLTAVHAQRGAPAPDGAAPQVLDSRVVTVRLLLGQGDRQQQDWSGRIAIDKGEVAGIEGWRFRQNDQVRGNQEWSAQTRPSVKAAAKKAAAKQAAILKAPGSNAA